jgi:hypothetical protein
MNDLAALYRARFSERDNDAGMRATSSFSRAQFRYVIAVPVLLYVATLTMFAVNVPVGDDHVVLASLIQLHEASDWPSWFRALLASHNEHRIVTTRAVGYVLSLLPQGVDFRILLILGNAALFGALAVLGRMLRFDRLWAAWAILALIVLQPQQHKLMFYPMANLQAYSGMLFSLAYLYFTLQRGREYVAIPFYLCAVLTTGGGLFLILLGTLILAMRGRWAALALHMCIAVPVSAWYLVDLRSAQTGALAYAIQHPWVVARLFLGILGNIAEFPSYRLGWISSYTTLTMAILLLAYIGVIVRRTAREVARAGRDADIGILVCIAYCLMMITLVVLSRAHLHEETALGASLDGRYRIYGLLIAALCIIDVLRQLDTRQRLTARLMGAVLAGALTFNVGWYAYRFDTIRFAALTRTHGLQTWMKTGDSSELRSWAVPTDTAAAILGRAVAAGVFRP